MLPAISPRVLTKNAATRLRNAKWLPLLAVQLCATLLLFPQLGMHDLWASHEARAAQDAQYLLTTHHWGLLRLVDGTPEYQKPPLYYWLVAATAWVRGGNVDELAVRLPAAIAGWLTVAVVMIFMQHRGRPRAAWIAGLVLTTTHHFLSISRTGRIDVPLTCAVTLAILLASESRLLAAALCLAAAMMLKGPVGVALVLAIVIASRPRVSDSLRVATCMAVACLVLTIPWFLAVGFQTNWEYWREFFLHHNLQRAAGTSADLASHPIWFYPLRALVDLFPWSLALPFAIWAGCQNWHADVESQLGLKWLIITIGLLSLSQFKRADYLLPAYPAAAILIGCWAERLRLNCWQALAVAITVAANMGYQFVILPRDDAAQEKRTTTALVRHHVQVGQQIIFFRVEDHLLAWRLGAPIATVREWENLDIWVSRLDPGFVLMSTDEATDWPDHLPNGTLHEVERLEDRTDRKRPRTWVLMRSRPNDTRARHDPQITDTP